MGSRHDFVAPGCIQPQSAQGQPAGRVACLDGWRGMALILVYLGHFTTVTAINLGALGVDCFFVLSGRLMAEILFVRNVPLPRFFLRRVSRIYPGMLVFVLAAAALFHAVLPVGPLAILSALSFTINYAILAYHATGLFDHLWSLCVEEHAYLLLGLVACLCRRFTKLRAPWVMAGLAAAAMLNGIVQYDVFDRGVFQVFWRSDVQVASILTAAVLFLWLRRAKLPAGDGWLALPLAAAGVLCKAGSLSDPPPAFISFGCGTILLALAVCLLERAEGPARRLFAFPPLRQVGLWSYSLYLWQQPFYQLHERGAPLYWTLPAAIACGLAGFYLIERPARYYLNISFSRHAAVQSVA